MPLAVNHDTGEVVFLDDQGQWQPAKRAVNPQTKKMLAFDGKDWSEIPSKGEGVMGYVKAALKGLESGVLFGFSPQIKGAAAQAGLMEEMPYLTDEQIAEVERQGGPQAVYGPVRDEEAKAQQEAREQYPKTYLGGELIGALAVPVGGAAREATVAAKLRRGAAIGAAAGTLSGVGHGETPEERVVGGVVGGLLGTAGGLATPLVEGGVAAARAVTPRITAEARRILNSGSEAERQVVTAIERDIAADPAARARVTPQEFVNARNKGLPVRTIDMGGDLTRRLADTAGTVSPEGRTALNEAVDQRFETQSPRLAAWLNKTFHYPDAAAQSDAINQVARTVNKPAYAKTYADGARGLWDEGFEQMAQAPVVQDAIRKTMVSAKNEAARMGFTPPKNPFVIDASGRLTLKADANGNRMLPSLQFWDYVKRNLDAVGTREAKDWARILREHADQLVPSYKTARAGAASFFGAENALEAGQNFVGASARYGIPAVRKALAKMSPTERQLFQDGYVSRLVEKIEKTPDRRSVLNQIGQSPAAQQELRIALGPERARELEARLRVEGVMDLARKAVQGNSWTARRLFDLGLGGSGISLVGSGGYNSDPKEMTVGAVMMALAAGKHRVDQNVMRKVAELLVSDDPTKLVRGVRIVAKNERLFQGLRSADQKLALAAGEQARNVPQLQAPGTGRADQDQNQVPRPPGQ